TRGAHAGSCTAPDGSCVAAGLGSPTGPGAHAGRPGGPDCGGATGFGWAGAAGPGAGKIASGNAAGTGAAGSLFAGATGGSGGFATGIGWPAGVVSGVMVGGI